MSFRGKPELELSEVVARSISESSGASVGSSAPLSRKPDIRSSGSGVGGSAPLIGESGGTSSLFEDEDAKFSGELGVGSAPGRGCLGVMEEVMSIG
jgi:hypothetical protein